MNFRLKYINNIKNLIIYYLKIYNQIIFMY